MGPLMLWDKYGLVPGRGVCVFDPMTMTAMALAGVAGGMSAAGTIAAGNTARTAGLLQQSSDNYQADQLKENEGGEIGAAQRQMIDTQQRAKLAASTVDARGAAGGINTDVGTPLADKKSIASRSSYQAMMDLFNGQNRAVGLGNQAKGLEFSGDTAAWSGDEQADLSKTEALATIAGSGANMGKIYGASKFSTSTGNPGVDLS